MAAPGQPRNSDLPADRHFAITPSNTTDLAITPRAIFVGGAGNVVIRDIAGVDVTYTFPAGSVFSFRAVRILATGTTATNLVGIY